jgi:Putative zinc-finger
MTCPDVRPILPALAYDDLAPDEAAVVRRHLDDCPGCRDEFAGLAHARAALDATPVPAVRVDVARLFTETAARQERRARRWRRAAAAAAALAAGLLAVLGLRLQVRVGAHELVIAWGDAPVSREGERLEGGTVNPALARAPDSPELAERLQLLQDLTHALAIDVDDRDRRRRAEVNGLRARLDALQRDAARKWAEAERYVSALYVAQFKPSEGGMKP